VTCPIPETYDVWYAMPFGSYADRLEKNLVRRLLPEVNRKLVLDVGCGTANYSIVLLGMGAHVVGVDAQLSMTAVAKLQSKKLEVGLEVVLADASALPFRAGVFDLSVSILALCFTRFPGYVIEEMRRATKQGGGLIVGTLNKWSPYGIGKKIRSHFTESSYRHAIFQSPLELKTLVCAAEWHSAIFAFEWMPRWLLRVLYRTDSELGRIFKPFGAFLATKTMILRIPDNAAT